MKLIDISNLNKRAGSGTFYKKPAIQHKMLDSLLGVNWGKSQE
jgi:hypothetical protein